MIVGYHIFKAVLSVIPPWLRTRVSKAGVVASQHFCSSTDVLIFRVSLKILHCLSNPFKHVILHILWWNHTCSIFQARALCLSLYWTPTEKLGLWKNSSYWYLLCNGDVPAVNKISVSTLLHWLPDAVVGDYRAVNWKDIRGMIFSVAFSSKSVISVKLQRALLKSWSSYCTLRSYCSKSSFSCTWNSSMESGLLFKVHFLISSPSMTILSNNLHSILISCLEKKLETCGRL